MRKDVKLGFAVGGVLLAVLVVYVSVMSRENKPSPSMNQTGQTVAMKENAPTAPQKQETAPIAPKVEETKQPAPQDPFANNTKKDTAGFVAPADGGLDWNTLLVSGPKSTQTPTEPVKEPVANTTVTPVENTPKVEETVSAKNDQKTNVTPVQTTVGGKTHIVAKGETFSTIALAEYGEARYFHLIIKANPQVDPSKLKIGTKLVLPDVNSVKSEVKAKQAKSDVNVGKNEYRVVSGDSLYKISMKLYGKGDRAEKIYELNKSLIGADKTKLKLNMVLKLPEAPTSK